VTLGIRIGLLQPGPQNAITDVAGVRVGHATLIQGDGALHIGGGPIRTGVTAVIPHDGDPFAEAVFAGAHRLNGNGELTGLEWIREAGRLTSPIATLGRCRSRPESRPGSPRRVRVRPMAPASIAGRAVADRRGLRSRVR
jgi:hypothetical protein